MRKYILLAIAATAVFTLASCKKDDGHSLDTSYYSLATVDNPQENPSGFVFTTDGGKEMWVAGTAITSYGPRNGSRIFANYSILYDRPDSDPYDHHVKLNDYHKVLVKDAVFLNEENEKLIGNDQISVRKIWVSGGFVNIDFILVGNDKAHYLNLVRDHMLYYMDGKIHLEFRHNLNEDAELMDLRGIVSFNPDPVLPEYVKLPADIVIHWKSPTGERSYEVSYDKAANEPAPSDNLNMGKAVFQ